MRTKLLPLAVVFSLVATSASAGFVGFEKTQINEANQTHLAQVTPNPLAMPKANMPLSVPQINQLEDQIDKNDTVIKKTPLPNFKLSPTTKKIINKLPYKLAKTSKPSKNSAKLKSEDFTGVVEPESLADAPAMPDDEAGFKISISKGDVSTSAADLELASKAYKVGQYESAISLYKKVLKESPKDRYALFGLATSYHKNKQKEQARAYYAKLLELYPYDVEGQNNFLTLVGEEAPEDALAELTSLAKANPDYAAIYAHKAMIYLKMGDDQNAIQNLNQALKINSANNEYKYNLAVLFDKNGYYENAAKLYGDLVDDSIKGKQIPASRLELTERMNFLSNKIKHQ